MAVINVKEVNRKLNAGLKLIREGVKMAKSNVIVGEIRYVNTKKPVRKPAKTRKARTVKKTTVADSPSTASGLGV